MADNDWGADPAKYKRLSKPHQSKEHATVAANAFLADVAKLREKHRVPELTVNVRRALLTDPVGPDETTQPTGTASGLSTASGQDSPASKTES